MLLSIAWCMLLSSPHVINAIRSSCFLIFKTDRTDNISLLYFRSFQDRYWCLSNGSGIQATGNRRCADALFELVWHGDGSVSFRANNGKFLATKRSGHLFATSESIEDITKFYFYLINRPILVLKCEQGFVGLRSQSTTKLECNKATYETILVERSKRGVVYFKNQNNKYWRLEGDGVTVDGDGPRDGFYLELREPTRICIR